MDADEKPNPYRLALEYLISRLRSRYEEGSKRWQENAKKLGLKAADGFDGGRTHDLGALIGMAGSLLRLAEQSVKDAKPLPGYWAHMPKDGGPERVAPHVDAALRERLEQVEGRLAELSSPPPTEGWVYLKELAPGTVFETLAGLQNNTPIRAVRSACPHHEAVGGAVLCVDVKGGRCFRASEIETVRALWVP